MQSRTVRCLSEGIMVATCPQNEKPLETLRCNIEVCKSKSSPLPSKVPKSKLISFRNFSK